MFSEGREDVNDEERAGRPSTSTTDEKINEVEKLILANRRITVREVAEDLNISIGLCHSIFINDLGMRRVAAKFVPKLLNCDQKQYRMNIANEMLDSVRDDPNLLQRVITGDEGWVYGYDVETKAQSYQWKLPHEPRPKKACQVRSNVKVLLTVFFDCRGVVHHEFLPQGRTVNKEYYLQVMRNLREAIRQKRPDLWKNKNWLLHHDNAPAHTSLLVRDLLAKNKTLMMPQPPYSPDLAPCHDNHAYGDAVMSRRRVFEWYKRFKEGREETADNERSGRPSTSTTPEKVDKVLELVREDRRITVREVAEEAGISFGSTQSIMKDILGVRRLNAVLVPQDLTFDQKNARKETTSLNLEATTDDPELLKRASEWRFKNGPRPKKARKAPSKVNVMLTVFFDYQGIVHHEYQQQGSTITAYSYLGVLRRLREAIRQKRPVQWRSKSWILHHDNAPAHKALKISKFLQDHSTTVFPQPPYSPDLAPCDFFLFGKLKKKS
ncbi:hypothetical protein LAZ67_4001822 [Cordylochernes scorpioides]|uniref:Transposase n=1 Tax=Cordylochernes scorpioides TaxID=51811 RepID=A0ABY6KC99_9ARAC|nr:hypothetical protein LAZ67_4001822 [Cordylochernes scorpioides]